jgi:hypothetical protein
MHGREPNSRADAVSGDPHVIVKIIISELYRACLIAVYRRLSGPRHMMSLQFSRTKRCNGPSGPDEKNIGVQDRAHARESGRPPARESSSHAPHHRKKEKKTPAKIALVTTTHPRPRPGFPLPGRGRNFRRHRQATPPARCRLHPI